MKARLDVSAGRASLDAVATRGYFKGAPAVRQHRARLKTGTGVA